MGELFIFSDSSSSSGWQAGEAVFSGRLISEVYSFCGGAGGVWLRLGPDSSVSGTPAGNTLPTHSSDFDLGGILEITYFPSPTPSTNRFG